MIATSIRAQYGGPPQTSFMYSKSYTKRIDNLRMPLGYQPLKFQQFDGKGNQATYRPLRQNIKGTKDFLVPKVRKDKKETKGTEKVVKSTVKESIVENATSLKFFKRKEGRAEKKG
ncbi:ty3-gypsy retrotransposon protein [Cucumis melo var. makuwa]|uniref:Ty3-gypsy retrotransposon protein n=1 Tax=Cucumis melo var. makuwa TaxID=1194695 RepID=A0A5A7SYK2_CUCMM|nr:ty3-gypsy retrotransposon protein [Cucumis melo var. makuwa]TYK30880.1 ty3-gypsy retrotransposon protein [Cucumis melo var. makuwa]